MGRTTARGLLSAAILLLALPAASARAGWTRVDLPGASNPFAAAAAGAAGTFYLDGMVSFDGARSWQASALAPEILDDEPIGAFGTVVVDPLDAAHVWAQPEYDPVLESHDAGRSYAAAALGTGCPFATVPVIDPATPRRWYRFRPDPAGHLGSPWDVCRSDDRGLTWTEGRSQSQPVLVPSLVGGASDLVALSWVREPARLQRSNDGGATWTGTVTNLSSRAARSVEASPLEPGSLDVRGDLGVWLSTDGGAHFRDEDRPGLGSWQAVPGHPGVVLANDAGVWRSTDGGRSFQGLDAPAVPGAALVVDPAGTAALLGDFGAVSSSDLGTTWTWQPFSGNGRGFGALLSDDAGRAYAATASGVLSLDAASGTWQRTAPEPNDLYEAVRVGPRALLASRQGLLRSVDGGATWHAVSLPACIDVPLEAGWVHPVRGTNVAYVLYTNCLVRSTDGGHRWRRVSAHAPGAFDLATVAGQPRLLYATDRGRLLASRDGGLHWRQLRRVPSDAWILAATSSAVWVGRRDGLGLVVAPNGHLVPTALPAGQPVAVLTVRAEPRFAALVTPTAVWITHDDGRSFTELAEPLLSRFCGVYRATLVAHTRVLVEPGGRCGAWLSDPVR